MSCFVGPEPVTSGLVLSLDAANPRSYPGTGTAWNDLSGVGNNGTLNNNPTYSSTNKGSFAFNGTTQYATCSGTPLNVTNYTKMVWFKLSSLAFTNNIVSGGSSHFMFFNAANKMYNGHADWASFVAYPSTATFSTGIWYNAALTFNTTDGMVLYVNGFQDSTYTAIKTQAPNSGIVEIAAYASANFLNGNVAQVSIYNRTLSAIEIQQNFEATRSRYNI
jgi:hypothetical protein